jgi:hypothetical protein
VQQQQPAPVTTHPIGQISGESIERIAHDQGEQQSYVSFQPNELSIHGSTSVCIILFTVAAISHPRPSRVYTHSKIYSSIAC